MGTGKNSEKIKDYQRQIAQGFFYIGVTIIVFTAVCIAWFVSNTKVTATGASISAANNVPLLLASTGERQIPESYDEFNNKKYYNKLLNFLAGESKKCDKDSVYYDYNEKESESFSAETTLYTGTSGLAWYLNGQQELSPGAGGELELYFIPQKSGLSEVTLKLTVEGKKAGGVKDDVNTLEDLKDETAKNFLNSHILFFEQYDESHGYRELLGKTKISSTSDSEAEEKGGYIFTPSAAKTITVRAKDFKDESGKEKDIFDVNVPYKVTIYWKWPAQFRNYVYSGYSYENDLFYYPDDEEPHDDQDALVKYLNKENSATSKVDSKDFYATGFFKKDAALDTEGKTGISIGTIGTDMAQENFANGTEYYNQADEYLGSNVNYILVRVDATVGEGASTNEGN